MKISLATRIFLFVVCTLAVLLVIQWLVVSRSFLGLYKENIVSSMRRELERVTSQYKLNKAQMHFMPFEEYAKETGSPMLVFTDEYQIVDYGLPNKMRMISFDHPTQGVAYLPVHYLYDVYGDNAPYLSAYRVLTAELVQVGNSAYYEPFVIYANGHNFRNRTNVKYYGRQVEPSFVSSIITSTANLNAVSGLQAKRAEYIYDHVKECLILKKEIVPFLEELSSKTLHAEGYDYRFIFHHRAIDGVRYFFVTVQRIIVTGFEQEYINEFFLILYLAFGAVIILMAYVLAKRISIPVGRITAAAVKIANLDFSYKVERTSSDELGILSRSINNMSETLQKTMGELKHTNAELAISAERSRRNEQRMKQLLGELAHEFKTPLGLIAGYIEVIQRGINREASAQYFGVIEEEIAELTDMVNEAIELTKLQSGNWKVNIGTYNLFDVIDPVIASFEERFRGMQFTCTCEIVDAEVYCDALRIKQVISNFISNALKYSNSKKELVVLAREEAGRCVITVKNSGYITQENLEKIWERNFSADGQEKTRLPSQGIGLSIVKSILEQHNSRYGCYQQNGYVNFFFTLDIFVGDT